MELMVPATKFPSRLRQSSHLQFGSGLCKLAPDKKISLGILSYIQQVPFQRSCMHQLQERVNRRNLSPPSAVSSGFETSILDAEDITSGLTWGRDKKSICCDFDKLGSYSTTYSRVPQARLHRYVNKVNKFKQVPKGLLLNMLGQERVTKFTIREIVTSVLFDYVTKENISVKDKKISTTQTDDELKLSFSPGKAFGFNAVLEVEETLIAEPEETPISEVEETLIPEPEETSISEVEET